MGTRLKTSTWSPPTFSTQSAMMFVVVTTLMAGAIGAVGSGIDSGVEVGSGMDSETVVGVALTVVGVSPSPSSEHAARAKIRVKTRTATIARLDGKFLVFSIIIVSAPPAICDYWP